MNETLCPQCGASLPEQAPSCRACGRLLVYASYQKPFSGARLLERNKIRSARVKLVPLSFHEAVARDFKTHKVFHSFLSVKAPYHSRFMDPLREELLASWADLHPGAASFPLYSAVTGTRITGRGSNISYWWHNTRDTVLFSAAVDQMIQDGYRVFVELIPHPVMSQSVNELLDEAGERGSVLPSLRLRTEDRTAMLRSLGSLYTLGSPVAWQALYPRGGNVVHLPSYPWQLKPYWAEAFESREDRLPAKVHALLGQAMSAAHPMWDLELSTRLLPFLVDHRVQGRVLLPASAYVEMALSAAREVFGEGSYVLDELTFRKALVLPETSDVRLQTGVSTHDSRVEIGSYTPIGESRFALHATAKLSQLQAGSRVPHLNLDALGRDCVEERSGEDLYLQAREMGLQYGPTFRALERVQILTTDRTMPTTLLGYLQAPAALEAELTSYTFHPALFDAACQVLLAFARPEESLSEPYLPASVERIQIFGRPVQRMLTYARLRQRNERFIVCDMQVADREGNLLALIEGFCAQALSASISLAPERLDRGLCELEWLPQERSDETEIAGSRMVVQEKPWIIFTDRSGVGETLVRCLEEHGERSVTVSQTDASSLIQQGEHYSINPANPEHFQQLCAALVAADEDSYGVVQDELLLRMTTETFQRVMRPKVRGSWLLHEKLLDYPLDFFLLFGSAGSVMPSLGQGNYAAANAFLDALASYRRSLGLPALSLGWGPWSVGMVERLKLEEFYTRRGLELITPEVGMQILGRVLGQRPAQLTAMSVNWALAREATGQGGLPPMFMSLGEQTHESTTSEIALESEFLEQLSAAEASERLPKLTSHLQETVARVLQLEASQFSGEEVLTSLGMDSLMAVEVRNRLAGSLKVDVSVMELLQGMTIVQLATRILPSLEAATLLENASSTVEVTRPLEELQQLVEQADCEELERLLAEIEQISETSDTSTTVSGGSKK